MHRFRDRRITVFARRVREVGERQEQHLVAIAAEPQPDHEDHRALEYRGHPERARRKPRSAAEERDWHRLVVGEAAVTEDADEHAVVQCATHHQHRVDPSERDDVLLRVRVDRGHQRIDPACVFLVHHHRATNTLLAATERVDQLETAHVRAHQECAALLVACADHPLLAFDRDVEEVEALVEQVQPVVDRSGERDDVLVDVERRHRSRQRAAQVRSRRATRSRREREKVERDDVDDRSRQSPAEIERQPRHQLQHRHRAALGAAGPRGAAHRRRVRAHRPGASTSIRPLPTMRLPLSGALPSSIVKSIDSAPSLPLAR